MQRILKTLSIEHERRCLKVHIAGVIVGIVLSISSSLSSPDTSQPYYLQLHKNVTADIGGEVKMECGSDCTRGENTVPCVFKWNKLGVPMPLLINFPGYPPHIDGSYVNRATVLVRRVSCWYCLLFVAIISGAGHPKKAYNYFNVNQEN